MAAGDDKETTSPKANGNHPQADSELSKKRKAEETPAAEASSPKKPKPVTAAGLSSLKRAKKPADGSTRIKGPTPALFRRRSPSPEPQRKSPSPQRSPPRQRKRPGASARINPQAADAVRQRQAAREQQERAQHEQVNGRGVQDFVRQHYNAVPERGRDFRRTDSLIKGLRSFNNWVKSALIQKFSPAESYDPRASDYNARYEQQERGLLVLDLGMGKGGDLQKWQSAPQRVELYVGVDPAEVSIDQARRRYGEMKQKATRPYRGQPQRLYQAEFFVQDCYGEWLGKIPLVRQVGISTNVGPDKAGPPQYGNFDVVSIMFSMHYAFESEQRARGMLKNVAGSLKKGGRFIGVIPNSDVLTAKAVEYHAKRKGKAAARPSEDDWDPERPAAAADASDDDWDPEKPADSKSKASTPQPPQANGDNDDDWDPEKPAESNPEASKEAQPSKEASTQDSKPEEQLEFGNKIYRVKFPGKVPEDGIFRPPFGWKYFYFMEESVDTVPEYIVPWEAFRALAMDYDLELEYRKPFVDVWEAEKDDPHLGPLSERMNVRGRDRGPLLVSKEELEAASFYHAFCFYKT